MSRYFNATSYASKCRSTGHEIVFKVPSTDCRQMLFLTLQVAHLKTWWQGQWQQIVKMLSPRHLLTMTRPELDNGRHKSTQKHEQGVLLWWLLLELPKLDLTSISNWQLGIVKDTQAWSYVTLSKFWELVVYHWHWIWSLLLKKRSSKLDLFIAWTLIDWAADFMSSISETEPIHSDI